VSAPTLDRPRSSPHRRLLRWEAVVIGEWFRLSDENPLTGRPYATSKSFQLPPYVLEAVTAELGVTEARWNDLVRRGEVFTVVGPRERFSLRAFLRQVRRRPAEAQVGPRTCEDCWGTLATHDWDGSMTGSTRNVYLCTCTMGLAVPSWS
jgi:hypothetical protein